MGSTWAGHHGDLSAGSRVVIVGGGFGGLHAARTLSGTENQVTLIDRMNHHLFQPLLYQVATSLLNPDDIAAPIRTAVRGANVTVLMADAQRVDPARKVVVCDHGDVPFDELILATGSTHSYFGHENWAAHAPGLKCMDDALEIRRRVLLAFELAEREQNLERRRQLLTFVIIGGGPTGVELAGALADISRHTLPGDFHNIDPRHARIILVEGLPRLLTAWPEQLSLKAQRKLEQMGVEVRTGTFVTNVDDDGVTMGAERIPTCTALWGAGVKASGLAKCLPVELDRAGRVLVTPTLNIPGRDDIFVIGDLASLEIDDTPVPGLAPAAIQMGRHAARNILRKHRGQPLQPFRYKNRGSFAVIGRGAAVGVVGVVGRRLRMEGVIAWLAWLGIHLFFLIGFRNRVSVMLGWMYSFFTRTRPTRLITGAPPYEHERDRSSAVEAPLPTRPRDGGAPKQPRLHSPT